MSDRTTACSCCGLSEERIKQILEFVFAAALRLHQRTRDDVDPQWVKSHRVEICAETGIRLEELDRFLGHAEICTAATSPAATSR